MRTSCVLIIGLCISLTGCSTLKTDDRDLKREFERSLSVQDFPESALRVLREYFGGLPEADYFEESDGESLSYEAKIELNSYQYSIEFSETGELQDVEKLVSMEEIPPSPRKRIETQLQNSFNSYSPNRVQIQYASDSLRDSKLLKMALGEAPIQLKTRYELEVEGKNRRELGYFEFLFDSEGSLIQRRRIFKRSIDNIW